MGISALQLLPDQHKALRADCHGSGDDGEEGAHGLAAAASEVLGEDPFSGAVIVFQSSDPGIATPQFLPDKHKAARAGLRADRHGSGDDGEEGAKGWMRIPTRVR